MRTRLTILLLASLQTVLPSEKTSMIETGPALGTYVPAFQATDQNGHVQTLASNLRPKGALLVFFRSADW